jgi:hypothetical protein
MTKFAVPGFHLLSASLVLSAATLIALATSTGVGKLDEQHSGERVSPVEVRFATTHCYRHFNNQRDVQACLKRHLGL